MADGVPLKLRPEPGEYRCTWFVPAGDGQPVTLQGDLGLRRDYPPRASVWGDGIPIEWTYSKGSKGAGFPQTRTYEIVKGRLLDGYEVILLDVTMSIWHPERALLFPRAALLGHDIIEREQLAFDGLKMQITGSDAVAGIGPLKSFTVPSNNQEHLSGSWTVEGQPASTQEWTDDDAELRMEYDGAFSLGDPFFYRMAFSPTVAVGVATPLSFDECFRQWVEPLQRILSLATGRRERVTYLSMSLVGDERPVHLRRCQVFGLGLHQDPYASRNDEVLRIQPAFRMAVDGLSMLGLARRWQQLNHEHHPLLETYGSSIVIRDQHPRSRYLLLVQALEGLYGYERRSEYSRREERHLTNRARVLAAVEISLYGDAKRFLKDYLMKRPPRNLDTCLRDLFRALPIDVTSMLAETALIKLMAKDPRQPQGVTDSLRLIRNDLSHGTRGYSAFEVAEVADILDRVARAHILRLLGCAEELQQRALQP